MKNSIRGVAVIMSKTVAIITVNIYIYDEYSMSLLSVAHSNTYSRFQLRCCKHVQCALFGMVGKHQCYNVRSNKL